MGNIKIGDYLQSESCSKHPVKVMGLTKEGDYITDEPDFHDDFGCSVFVIDKEKAIKVPTPSKHLDRMIELLDEMLVLVNKEKLNKNK